MEGKEYKKDSNKESAQILSPMIVQSSDQCLNPQ